MHSTVRQISGQESVVQIPQGEHHFVFFEQNFKFCSEPPVKLLTAQMQSSRARSPPAPARFPPPSSERAEERGRRERDGHRHPPLAAGGFPVIRGRCVAGLQCCITVSRRMQLQPARQCEGVSTRLLKKKIQLKCIFVSSQKYFDAVRSNGHGETGNNLTAATLPREFQFMVRRNFLMIGEAVGLSEGAGPL